MTVSYDIMTAIKSILQDNPNFVYQYNGTQLVIPWEGKRVLVNISVENAFN
jgi:hypothetical protein